VNIQTMDRFAGFAKTNYVVMVCFKIIVYI